MDNIDSILKSLQNEDVMMTTDKEAKQHDKKVNKISLPRKILALKNIDKMDHESWDEKHRKNICNFPSPFRCALIGDAGKGKTTLVKNILLNARPLYDRVFLIHPDIDVTKEYADIEPTECMQHIPPISYFSDVIDPDEHKKNICIIDDVEFSGKNKEELHNLGLLVRYLSTHRNMSVIFSHQSWFDVPPIVKKMSNVFIIYRPRSLDELSRIENRCGVDKGLFRYIFDNIATGYRDNICYDLTENSPAKLRKNLFDVLEVEGINKDFNNQSEGELSESSEEY